MDKIRGILSLPLSRKVFIALLLGLLAFLNAKFKLGVPDEAIYAIAAVAVAVILGISIEDAAKWVREQKPPAPPKGHALVLLLVVAAILGAGAVTRVALAQNTLSDLVYETIHEDRTPRLANASAVTGGDGPARDGSPRVHDRALTKSVRAVASEEPGGESGFPAVAHFTEAGQVPPGLPVYAPEVAPDIFLPRPVATSAAGLCRSWEGSMLHGTERYRLASLLAGFGFLAKALRPGKDDLSDAEVVATAWKRVELVEAGGEAFEAKRLAEARATKAPPPETGPRL